ncbi:MAG: tRNA 4-thiouridine(8) synthase ThiI [Spirochaetaceae bacterium]|jgi:thiamine biosynthesis protein ThiI|nr:tRNA 4-thiouridine(8) synthase ThiI [Spirochaetaceae bacterium]
MITYLLKPGELTLKGGNRSAFERVLKRNLDTLLGNSGPRVEIARGRFYLRCPEGTALDRVEEALDHLLGIAGWAKTRVCEKTPQAVLDLCVETGREFRDRGILTFKLEARRTDKSFPLDSYGIRSKGGEAILEALPELTVDVHRPQGIIEVEIREKAYVYGTEKKGLRGLPVGTAGRGLLLLSGGIDSPVAGYLMASRGMRVDGVYFHAYPYTSEEARRKVLDLVGIIGGYTLGMRLYTVGFTQVQLRIRDGAPEPWATVLLRMAMMECAEKLAGKRHSKCLITGESLSQVASQTIENIGCTQSRIGIPVLRPLIGMDKDRIIRMAETIGTYKTSILPYQDCCALFSPPHPVLRGDVAEAGRLYEGLGLGDLIDGALRESLMERCGYP